MLQALPIRNARFPDYIRIDHPTVAFNLLPFSRQINDAPVPPKNRFQNEWLQRIKADGVPIIYGRNHYDTNETIRNIKLRALDLLYSRLQSLNIPVSYNDLRNDVIRDLYNRRGLFDPDYAKYLLSLLLEPEILNGGHDWVARLLARIMAMVEDAKDYITRETYATETGTNVGEHNFDVLRFPISREETKYTFLWAYSVKTRRHLDNFQMTLNSFIVQCDYAATAINGTFEMETLQLYIYSFEYHGYVTLDPQALVSRSAIAVSPEFTTRQEAVQWVRTLTRWMWASNASGDREDFDPGQIQWLAGAYIRKDALWQMITDVISDPANASKSYAILTVINGTTLAEDNEVTGDQVPGGPPNVPMDEEDVPDDDHEDLPTIVPAQPPPAWVVARRRNDRERAEDMLNRIHNQPSLRGPGRQRKVPARFRN